MTLLSVSHKKQRQPADCLAACAAMVLEYLQVSVAYNDIVEQFETRYFGAPFFNVHKLEAMGLFVVTGEWGELNTIKAYLQKGLPILVNVQTGELRSYWERETSHVVLVIGFEDEKIVLLDPAFDNAPKRVSVDEFMLAWSEQYQRYGVIALEEVDSG